MIKHKVADPISARVFYEVEVRLSRDQKPRQAIAAATTAMADAQKPQVRFLRRLAGSLLRYWQIISVICYVAGVITVLLLPVLAKQTYISENALMPGSANTIFTARSARDARVNTEELEKLITEGTDGYMAVRRWAMDRMAAMGADSYLHTFSSPEKPLASLRFFASPQHVLQNTTDEDLGVNVVGIIKAPRSEGNEAVVLVTPFTLEEGRRLSSGNKLTLAFGMALLELYSRANSLARDVIWIMADARYGAHSAVAAWLAEYHEPQDDVVLLEFKRAGFISAGLVFDISPGQLRGHVDTIKVSAEGPNGQMPNLDLINVINTLAQWRRLHVQLDEITGMRDSAFIRRLGSVVESVGNFVGQVYRDWGWDMSASSYAESVATLSASFLNQAIGRSTGAHGAFRDYQIDAVTLNMLAGGDLESSSYQIDLFTRYGRLVEGVMRSVNNLLEKFHQSFFLYLLSSPSKFVSVGLYMIPLGLLLVTLPLGAAALNGALTVKEEDSESGAGSSQTLDIKTTNEKSGRWRHAIIVVTAVQLWSILVALLPPAISSLAEFLQRSLASPVAATASSKMALWTTVSFTSLVLLVSSLPAARPGDWMAVKALVLGLATIAVVVMSQVDFAVALMGALVLVPTCLCPSPLKLLERDHTSFVASALLAILYYSFGSGVITLERLWVWTELLWSEGSALYIFLVVVYLPYAYLSLDVLFS